MNHDSELERLRDWKHEYVTPLLLHLKLVSNEHTNQLKELDDKLNDLTEAVDLMVEEDRIATAVNKRIKERNKLELTIAQKVGGAAVIIMAVVDFVRGFTG